MTTLRTKASKFDLLNAVHYLRLGYQSMSLVPGEAHAEALAAIAKAGDDQTKQVLLMAALIVDKLGLERVTGAVVDL
jgi:hypothetical protein